MDKLYDHVLKRQEARHQKEMKEMRDAVGSLRAEMKAIRGGGKLADDADRPTPTIDSHIEHKTVGINHGVVDQSTKVTKNTININIFGCENTSHISHQDVLGFLQKMQPLGSDLDKAAERLLITIATKIFSDEKKPENLTCYLPNKKGKDVLVHRESGWEVMPMSLTMPPMAARSVEELFKKQPWPGVNGIPSDLKLEQHSRLLKHIADHEGDLVGNAALPSSEMRTIAIRNKDLLERALHKLPVAGDR